MQNDDLKGIFSNDYDFLHKIEISLYIISA